MAAVIPRPGDCRLDTSVKRDTTVTKQDDNNKVLASGPEELASALASDSAAVSQASGARVREALLKTSPGEVLRSGHDGNGRLRKHLHPR